MGVNVFPAASGGASYSSQPPANTSSVLLDGQLNTTTPFTTTITGTGSSAFIYVNTSSIDPVKVTVGGVDYYCTPNTLTQTAAISGSTSVTINPSYSVNRPVTYLAPLQNNWQWGAVGSSVFVMIPIYDTGTTATCIYGSNSSPFTTQASGTMASTSNWSSVTWDGTYFVAIGGGGGASSTVTNYSTNGSTWTATSTLQGGQPWAASASGTIGATTYTIAVAGFNSANPTFNYTTNHGVNWTSISTPVSAYWNGIAFGNGKFVALGSYNAANSFSNNGVYSTNGTTWTAMTMPLNSQWNSITYGNGVFMATTGIPGQNIATGSNCAISTDGINWTIPGGSMLGSYQGLVSQFGSNYGQPAYGAGYFFVIGQGNGSYPNNAGWAYYTANNGKTFTIAPGASGYGYGNMICVTDSSNRPNFIALPGGQYNAPNGGNYSVYFQLTNVPMSFGIYNGSTSTH